MADMAAYAVGCLPVENDPGPPIICWSREPSDGRRVIAMLETDKLFAGSIPENYDRYMVPLIFEPYAADLAQRAASFAPGAVLEIAAGTGVVPRALAPRLSRGASYIVTDLNQPMLDYAASRQAPDNR